MSEHNSTPFKNDPSVQQLFDSAKEDLGSDEQVARIAVGLAVLGAGGAVMGAAKVSQAAGVAHAATQKSVLLGSLWGKAFLGSVVAAGLIGTGALVNQQLSEPPKVAPRVAPVTVQQVERPAMRGTQPEAAQQESEPEPEAKQAPSPRRTGSVPPPTQTKEARLLLQARQALDSSPEQALSLVRAHATAFPNSVLAQEREVIRITALSKLGRADEAKQSAERFKRDFPESVHRSQVESMGLGGNNSNE